MAGWGSRSILFLSSPLRSARSFFPAAAAAATVVRGFGFSTCAVQPHLERVGFIGLGNMGFHMANNLINAGYKVTVHDINHNALKKFVEKGIPTKETPFDIAKTSDVVITMLPSSTHFGALSFGEAICFAEPVFTVGEL